MFFWGDTSHPPNPEEFETPFIWPLGFDLSGMVKPIRSYAATGIALGFKWSMQFLRYEKAVYPGGN
jgi:hypothetical protein